MKKLYYDNAYLKNCESTIILCSQKENTYFIKLDNCIFYPQGGGQKGDRGYIEYNNKKLTY